MLLGLLMKIFFLVLAKDDKYLNSKLKELANLNVPYLVVSGQKINLPNIVYREPKGKYDAINFGLKFIPKDFDVIALNDVDTKILNFNKASALIEQNIADLVFASVKVNKGPQIFFYRILDFIRRRILVTASGELMLVRRPLIERMLPIKPCKAEDSYILFKALELKQRAIFCEECYIETERTKTAEMEEKYKRKTVCGLYQALGSTKPPLIIRLFYVLLPFFSPLLLVLGKRGYYWMKGILLGLNDYLRNDKSGTWSTSYMA
jgi:hypothetical protein